MPTVALRIRTRSDLVRVLRAAIRREGALGERPGAAALLLLDPRL